MTRRRFGQLAAGTALSAVLTLNSRNSATAMADSLSCELEAPALGEPLLRVETDSAYTGDNLPRVEVAKDLLIVPRSAWAEGLEPKAELQSEEVKFLLVHHSATTNSYEIAHVPQTLRGVYNFHTGVEKGWADVCYNFFIDKAGNVYEGRKGSLDGPVMADATGGNQGFAQLICLLGDFTDTSPTCEMENSLVKMLAWNSDRFNINTAPDAKVSFVSRGANGAEAAAGMTVTTPTIAPHNKMSATACPGNMLTPIVQDGTLQTWVNNYRQSLVAPPVVVPTPTETVPVPATTTTVQPQVAISTTTENPFIPQAPEIAPTETTDSMEVLGKSLIGAGLIGLAVAVPGYVRSRRQTPEDEYQYENETE